MEARQPNRLIHETSPYLLQHAHNPVRWWPWCEEALAEARRLDRPILLSIGYSACHWCHVMERESFEDESIAGRMNEDFVCVKVDREERPDLDQVYQTVVQAMTGHGGWPLTVFLTPDGRPFFGGTYFPPEPRHGMPGFPQLLDRIADAWRSDREGVVGNVTQLMDALRRIDAPVPGGERREESPLPEAVARLARGFDTVNGGFGGSPKFPHAVELELMLRASRAPSAAGYRGLVRLALDRMARGGIYDHLGGGFHRYSVDEAWAVPHFEKMLYDNALLPRAYLAGWQATGEAHYARVVRETLAYVRREMTHPQGGFYSSQDADSEGEEGRFFVWTPVEIRAVLGGADADLFMAVYGVTRGGNFEGRNVLHVAREPADVAMATGASPAEVEASLARSRAALLAARETRAKPARDEKVVTSWNGLMISAFAEAAAVLGDEPSLAAARDAAEFLWRELRTPDGRLRRTWRDGRARIPAFLDDHTHLAAALLDLYEADFDPLWIERARELMEGADRRFSDGSGGWYLTADDSERLIQRPRSHHDQSIPSGTALGADAALRLAALTGEGRWERRVEAVLERHRGDLLRHPFASASLLGVADRFARSPKQVVVVGGKGAEAVDRLLTPLRQRYEPEVVVAFRDAGAALEGHPAAALLDGKEARDGAATAYVCQRSTCSAPVTSGEGLVALLEGRGP
ncbi:thioredoxin domain-containing protein [Myxococcota bacterium]|nr:thioredoxin domain-containing protein [Myxococcota bacterium]